MMAVKEGRFRKDLFHRLSQFQLRVPPLRERPEDIAALAQYFLALKAPDKSFPTTQSQRFSLIPGRAISANCATLLRSSQCQPLDREIGAAEVTTELNQEVIAAPPVRRSLPQGNLENMEEQMIIQALEQTGGHSTQAAEQLGISRRTLSRKLREYGIDANIERGLNSARNYQSGAAEIFPRKSQSSRHAEECER